MSAEHQAFREAYYSLSQAITYPEALAGLLWSRGIISNQERRAAEQVSMPGYNRTIALLDVLSQKIELQPGVLNNLVMILSSSGDPTLVHMARQLQSALSTGSSTTQPSQTNRESTSDFTEEQMLEFFKKIGLPQKDTDLLIDDGFGTGPGFMELTKEDIEDMKFTRGGKKILLRHVSSDAPVPMDTMPPASAMYPIPKHPAMDNVAGGPPPPFTPYTPPPEPLTADSIADEIGLDPYVLDTEFSDNYSVILAFAKVMPEWKQIGQSLHLSPQDLRSIETNVSLSYLMQCTETLKKWKSRYGFKAKYRMLIEAALQHGEDKLAIQFCRLVQRYIGGSQPVRVPAQPAPTVVKAISLDTLIEALRSLPFSRSNHGQLARALGVSEYKLSEIEANNYQDIAQVRTQILAEWMRTSDEELSWQTVARAVMHTGDKNLARALMAYRTPAA